MSLQSQATIVLTQNPPLLAVFITASFRVFYVGDPTVADNEVAAAAGVVGFNFRTGASVDNARNLAYVANGADTLFVVDIADSLNPLLTDSIVIGGGSDQVTAAAAVGDNIYVTDEADNDVYVVDASDPANLVQINEFQTDDPAFAVAQVTPVDIKTRGNYLFIVNYDLNSPPIEPSMLAIYDATNPLAVIQLATTSWGVPVNDQVQHWGSVALAGQYAYCVVAGILHIVRIEDPANPVAVSDTAISATAFRGALNQSATRMLIIDQTASPNGTIRLWDVTDLENPSELDSFTAQVPSLAYVALGPKGLFYVTSGDSGNPTQLAIYSTAGDQITELTLGNSIATGNGAALACRSPEAYEPPLRI